MQGIPKTYNFQRCTDAKEFSNMMKQNNIELLKHINLFSWYEFQSGEMFVIYKNDIRIGYLCLSDLRSVINTLYRYIDAMKEEEDIHIKTHGKDQFDKSINLADKHIKLFEHAIQYTNASHMLDIGLLEIIKEHRSFNTIKVVFNFIKEYCIKHKFDFAFCGAKNEAVARLYRIGGFKYIPDTDKYICMYLAINQKDYYEVSEQYKKLYESIIKTISEEVKKALNESQYGNSNEQNEILLQYIYNADLEHCWKSDILLDSWIEEQYADENDIEYGEVNFNKEFFDYCKDAFIDNLYKGTDSFIMDENNMIYCERMLYIKNLEIETILENSLGIYWAWDEGNAEAINSQEAGNVVLYAHVAPENVDWAQTIVSNLIDPDETEITIKKDAPIILNKIVADGEVIYNQNTECTT